MLTDIIVSVGKRQGMKINQRNYIMRKNMNDFFFYLFI